MIETDICNLLIESNYHTGLLIGLIAGWITLGIVVYVSGIGRKKPT